MLLCVGQADKIKTKVASVEHILYKNTTFHSDKRTLAQARKHLKGTVDTHCYKGL